MRKTFKYQQQIDELVALGYKMPALQQPNALPACRFAFGHSDERNHIPQYMSNPRRMLHDVNSHRATTSFLALSCFTTAAKASAFFKSLCKVSPRAALSIGDSLAEGVLVNDDGMITAPERNGHFDLYEYTGCDLQKTFTITQHLI